MKFKNTRKTLAAILSVLTMMPNCYQLEPGKTGKAKSSQSKQKAGGDVRFLSKNTTMTTGERIGENLLFSVLALLTGGLLFSKCGGNTSSSLDKTSSSLQNTSSSLDNTSSSLQIDPRQSREKRLRLCDRKLHCSGRAFSRIQLLLRQNSLHDVRNQAARNTRLFSYPYYRRHS